MPRVLALVALVACLSDATLAYWPGFTEECDQACAGDVDGKCPPACHDCTCCLYRTPVPMPVAVTVEAPLLSVPVPEFREVFPPSPEPHDILHVPKRVLA
jgi:hypothetical protein